MVVIESISSLFLPAGRQGGQGQTHVILNGVFEGCELLGLLGLIELLGLIGLLGLFGLLELLGLIELKVLQCSTITSEPYPHKL